MDPKRLLTRTKNWRSGSEATIEEDRGEVGARMFWRRRRRRRENENL